MPDNYYTLEEFNKRITKRLKPPSSLVQKFRGLRFLKLPLLNRQKRIKQGI